MLTGYFNHNSAKICFITQYKGNTECAWVKNITRFRICNQHDLTCTFLYNVSLTFVSLTLVKILSVGYIICRFTEC